MKARSFIIFLFSGLKPSYVNKGISRPRHTNIKLNKRRRRDYLPEKLPTSWNAPIDEKPIGIDLICLEGTMEPNRSQSSEECVHISFLGIKIERTLVAAAFFRGEHPGERFPCRRLYLQGAFVGAGRGCKCAAIKLRRRVYTSMYMNLRTGVTEGGYGGPRGYRERWREARELVNAN